MKKNVAGQVVGVQMTDASDGSAFTGSVVAYVTGDNGTQTIGSVSSGACTHKGNGLHTYAPAQAETNYEHVVFTFVGTGAIVVSVQVYTDDDSVSSIKAVTDMLGGMIATDSSGSKFNAYALEDAPTGGSAPTAAEIADAVWDEDITDHLTGGSTGAALNAAGSAGDPWTTPLPGAYGSGTAGYIVGTNLDAQVSTAGGGLDAAGVRAAIGLASANLDTQLDALPTAAENTTAVWAAGARTLTAIDEDSTTLDLDATIRGALGMAAADLDTQIDTLATASALATAAGYIDTEVAAIKAKTDNLPSDPADASDIAAAIAGLDIPTVDEIWDEAVDGTVTARQSMRLQNSALAGKASGLDTTSVAFRDLADTKDRITATVTADGNRTAVTTDLT